MAWDRFYPPGADGDLSQETDEESLFAALHEARERLAGCPAPVNTLNGRPYLHLPDYQAWPARGIAVDLTAEPNLERGVVVASWDAWIQDRWKSGTDRVGGIAVREMWLHLGPVGDGDVQAIGNEPALLAALEQRRMVLTVLSGVTGGVAPESQPRRLSCPPSVSRTS